MTKIQLEKLDVINYCRIYDKIVKKILYKNSMKRLSSRFPWKTLEILKSVSSATSASGWWHLCYHSLLRGPDKIKYSKIYLQKKSDKSTSPYLLAHLSQCLWHWNQIFLKSYGSLRRNGPKLILFIWLVSPSKSVCLVSKVSPPFILVDILLNSGNNSGQ